jgi:hypothetical protein
MMLLLALAALAGAKPSDNISDKKCTVDHAAISSLNYDRFDQDDKSGWRPLAKVPECRRVAADTIDYYLKSNSHVLTLPQIHVLYWHEGQVLALLNDRAAIPFLLAGVDPENNDIDFSDYAVGTVAFLQKDLRALKSARDRLAAKPIPAWYNQARTLAVGKGQPFPNWPLNLDVLDGLIHCFGRSYDDAYSEACRTHDGRE